MANSGKFGKRLILAACLHKQNVTFIFPISKILFLDLKSASGFVRVIWNSNSFIKKACPYAARDQKSKFFAQKNII